jgi:hypothetical protein
MYVCIYIYIYIGMRRPNLPPPYCRRRRRRTWRGLRLLSVRAGRERAYFTCSTCFTTALLLLTLLVCIASAFSSRAAPARRGSCVRELKGREFVDAGREFVDALVRVSAQRFLYIYILCYPQLLKLVKLACVSAQRFLYVCMYVCMYIYTHTHMYIHTYSVNLSLYIYIYMYIHICTISMYIET